MAHAGIVFVSCLAYLVSAASPKPHIVQIVADDLGYNDLGSTNGGKTSTPAIDSLINDGVWLTDYYAFRLCSPSRASVMTGRYPWSVGFYDMSNDEHHCVHPSFKMLPELLKGQGYRTHATGKWDVGYVKQHCTPTFRGFETFLGYYEACTSDYWYHGAKGGNWSYSKCGGIDFHNSTTGKIQGAAMSGRVSTNGTYDRDVFTSRAVDIIKNHNASEPLYLYVAFHNVHDACNKKRREVGLQAPLETVEKYGTTQLDSWKVQAAMTTELDYGVGNITHWLKQTGLWDNTLLLFMSDNGGPLDHSANAPLRGGKGSEFEGGYRVVAFVSGPVLPSGVRGSNYSGMMHMSDWYTTIASIDGVAGFALPRNTGIVPVDGHNLWPALTGVNLTSPRTEVIHSVNNRFFNASIGDVGVQSARFGDWKLITGLDCNSLQVWQPWPAPVEEQVPFGKSNGTLEHGTDHARAPLLDHIRSNGERGAAPDPTCAHGLLSEDRKLCCPEGCDSVAGCCDKAVEFKCSLSPAPCSMGSPLTGSPQVCLYNLKTDLSERVNLAGDPQYAPLLEELIARLKARAESGPDIAIAFADVGPVNKTVDKATRKQELDTGYLEPVDWSHGVQNLYYV